MFEETELVVFPKEIYIERKRKSRKSKRRRWVAIKTNRKI